MLPMELNHQTTANPYNDPQPLTNKSIQLNPKPLTSSPKSLLGAQVLLVNPPTDMPDLEAKVQEILSCLQDAFHPIFSMESSYLKL